MPAHNVPVADPSYLPKVVKAIQQVRRGEAKPVSRDGKREYVFDGFSFLTVYGTDISVIGNGKSNRSWSNGSGFNAAGLDDLIETRKEYYARRQWERILKRGDRGGGAQSRVSCRPAN